MRRLFIMRKDLQMSPGKMAAQVGHCAEVYWLKQMNRTGIFYHQVQMVAHIDEDVYEDYIHGNIIKTICEAKNKNHLLKAKTVAEELGLKENEDFGFIEDKCFTELTPEEEDGTTITGIWFKPLPDDISHIISKKYQLYK